MKIEITFTVTLSHYLGVFQKLLMRNDLSWSIDYDEKEKKTFSQLEETRIYILKCTIIYQMKINSFLSSIKTL